MRLLIAVSSEGIHPFGSSVRLSLNRTAKDNLVWASVQGGEDLWLSSGLLSLLRQWAGDGTHDSVENFGQEIGRASCRDRVYIGVMWVTVYEPIDQHGCIQLYYHT